jgi:uncharacterized membrane protein
MKQNTRVNNRINGRSGSQPHAAQRAGRRAAGFGPLRHGYATRLATVERAARVAAAAKATTAKATTFFSKEAREGSTLNFYHLFWIFVISSVIGLVLETIYHALVFGGYESRVGLVWGPFSPIYGCGAVLFTLLSRGKQVERRSRTIIMVFLTCAIGGAALEFIASWLMQNVFGVVAWDYSGEFLNIDGRTSLLFGVLWGLLGTAWICWFLPVMIRVIDRIPENRHVIVTMLLSLFMLLNILTTLMAVGRAYERSQGIAEQTQIDALLDFVYSDEVLAKRFENAAIYPEGEGE